MFLPRLKRIGRSVKPWGRAGAITGFVALISLLGLAGWRVSRVLRVAREEARSEREIRFMVRPLLPPIEENFETISTPAVFVQAAPFQDHLYIAGPAAMLEFDNKGTPLRQFTVGRELPSSPLVALAPAILSDAHEPELVLATANQGIVLFNGHSFRQIFPQDAAARDISAILPVSSGHLLIGTEKRGVLLYDGKQITVLHPTMDHLHITALAGTESDLWVGTLDRGVLHWHAGQTELFGENQGLPDNQVTSIALSGDKTYVGTVIGVAVFDAGRFSRVLAPGVFATALLPEADQLFVGSEDQGIIPVQLSGRARNFGVRDNADVAEIRQIFNLSGENLALTSNGIYRIGSLGAGLESVLTPGKALLSDRNVSALAFDNKSRLWIGFFNRGLDVLDSDRGPATHLEDEHVFCINRILPDAKTGSVDAATANGLVRFDADGHEEQVLTRTDGLIANHVTDLVRYAGGLALATPAGLTFLDAAGARSMYAFHGLVNNHVYALGASGDELLAGTLGGLSLLDKGDVLINYTSANSELKRNWVTAIARAGDEWMVGTYGAGVVGLDRSGEFHSFEKATGPFEVNPNAMLVTADHVFAGTAGNGLYVYERASGRWFAVESGLPSFNVTALAINNGYVYIGTDNGLVRVPEQKLHP